MFYGFLRDGWAPTFAKKSVNKTIGESVLEQWAGKFDWKLAKLPGEDTFAHVISHAGDASPGPDGTPVRLDGEQRRNRV